VDYKIVTFDPNTGLASIGIPAVQKILTGLDLLVQIVVLSFLRNPGKSVMFPAEGSGLRKDIGQYTYTLTGNEIQLLAVQRTRYVQQEVISRQDPNQGTPYERLQSLTLKNVAFDPTTSNTIMQVKLISEAGDSRDILV